MIARIWLRIVASIAVTVIPAMLLETEMLSDAINVVYQVIDGIDLRTTSEDYMRLLKESAQRDPEHSDNYRQAFQRAALTRQAVEQFYLVREALRSDIRKQTIRNTLAVLALSLGLALLVSRAIVHSFRRLLVEREAATRKLAELGALTNWQKIARMLVHELKAPITPIKLIATDIETKFTALSVTDFAAYLQQSQQLIRTQIEQMELMVQSFTRFGQLPPASPLAILPDEFLTEFCRHYATSFGAEVAIYVSPTGLSGTVRLDPKLGRDLLFNLAKNAVEANAGRPLRVTITLTRDLGRNCLTVANDGAPIPQSLVSRIFEPYASGHQGAGLRANMGLGLTICKKIAYDHGGDLSLTVNDPTAGVQFRFEWPEQAPQGAEGLGDGSTSDH